MYLIWEHYLVLSLLLVLYFVRHAVFSISDDTLVFITLSINTDTKLVLPLLLWNVSKVWVLVWSRKENEQNNENELEGKYLKSVFLHFSWLKTIMKWWPCVTCPTFQTSLSSMFTERNEFIFFRPGSTCVDNSLPVTSFTCYLDFAHPRWTVQQLFLPGTAEIWLPLSLLHPATGNEP